MIGLELGQDAHDINLDRSLKSFSLTKKFLSDVVSGVCARAGLTQEQVFTEGAMNRLVQASGGVARDLLNLIKPTIEDARERYARSKSAPRVSADDTWSAAASNYNRKRLQFAQDMDATDQQYYLLKLDGIKEFCFANFDNRVLVSAEGASTASSEFRILWDAKFIHIIDDGVRFGGHSYTGYCLDIGTHASDSSRRRIVMDLSGMDKSVKSLEREVLVFKPPVAP
jgi:hypothetical protein